MASDYIKRKRLLLVDDEPELLDMVVSILREDGYENIRTAGTVEEALKEAVPSGNLIRRYMKTKDLEVAPVELPIEVAADAEKVSAFVNEKCGGIITQAANASITRENGEFVITPSQTGRTVDLEATQAALSEAVMQAGSGEIRVEAVTAEPGKFSASPAG